MKSKFNSKSVSRAATLSLSLSLSLLAPAKSFASDAFALGADTGKPAIVVLLNGASEDREELDVRSLADGVLTSLRGINITRTDRTLVVSGTAENDLFISTPDFNVIADGVIRAKQLAIFAEIIFVPGYVSLDSTSTTLVSGAGALLNPVFVAPSMCETISVTCQDFASGFADGFMSVLRPTLALATDPIAAPVEAGDDSSDED